MVRVVEVRLHGRPVGTLWGPADRLRFQYTDEALQVGVSCKISHSLPLKGGDCDATNFFSGLLPDNPAHLGRLYARIGLQPGDRIGLLARLGGDCAGAVSFRDPGEGIRKELETSLPLSEAEVSQRIDMLDEEPLMVSTGGAPASLLAGFNRKAAIVLGHNSIRLPDHETPSTHILKPDIPGLPGTALVEHFCLRLATASGLEAVKSHLVDIAGRSAILVERFDRKRVAHPTGLRVESLHQEDFCQAIGLPPERKQQRRGGPGWSDCFRLLDACTSTRAEALKLIDAAIFQWLIGNPDAHAKNYAISYEADGQARLAPLYDLNNAAAFRPFFRSAKPIMAMSVGAQYDRDEVQFEDWRAFSSGTPFAIDEVTRRMGGLTNRIMDNALALRDEFGMQDRAMLDTVVADIACRVQKAIAWGTA